MYVPLPSVNRVLVVAPHPDDEALGCGGTIACYARSGAHVGLVVVSDGAAAYGRGKGPECLTQLRKAETRAASDVLGVSHLDALDYPDSRLSEHESDIRRSLQAVIERFSPELVLSPSLIESHPDHVTVALILLELLKEQSSWRLAFFEVDTALRPNVLVPIDQFMAQKGQAILCYQRSLFGKPEVFSGAMKGLSRYRSFAARRSSCFEALWLVPSQPHPHELLRWIVGDKAFARIA